MKDIGIPEKQKKSRSKYSYGLTISITSALFSSFGPVIIHRLEGGEEGGGGRWGIFEGFTLSGGVKIKLSRSAQKAMHAPTVSFL